MICVTSYKHLKTSSLLYYLLQNFLNPMPWAEWKNSPWKVQFCPHYRKFWLPRRIHEMPTIDLTWLGKGMAMWSPCYNSQWYQATIHYPKLAKIKKHYHTLLIQLTYFNNVWKIWLCGITLRYHIIWQATRDIIWIPFWVVQVMDSADLWIP